MPYRRYLGNDMMPERGQRSAILQCKELQKIIYLTLEKEFRPLQRYVKDFADGDILRDCLRKAEEKMHEKFAEQMHLIQHASEREVEALIHDYPKTEQYLSFVGVDEDVIQGMTKIREICLMQLLDMSDQEIVNVLTKFCAPPDNGVRLISALNLLRKEMDKLNYPEHYVSMSASPATNPSHQRSYDPPPCDSNHTSGENNTEEEVVEGVTGEGEAVRLSVSSTADSASHSRAQTPHGYGGNGDDRNSPPGLLDSMAGREDAVGFMSEAEMEGDSDPHCLNGNEEDEETPTGFNMRGFVGPSRSVPSTPGPVTRQPRASASPPSSPLIRTGRGIFASSSAAVVGIGSATNVASTNTVIVNGSPKPGTPPPNHRRIQVCLPDTGLYKSLSHESDLHNRVGTASPGGHGSAVHAAAAIAAAESGQNFLRSSGRSGGGQKQKKSSGHSEFLDGNSDGYLGMWSPGLNNYIRRHSVDERINSSSNQVSANNHNSSSELVASADATCGVGINNSCDVSLSVPHWSSKSNMNASKQNHSMKSKTAVFPWTMAAQKCALCQKPIRGKLKQCRYCKNSWHPDCAIRASSSCNVPSGSRSPVGSAAGLNSNANITADQLSQYVLRQDNVIDTKAMMYRHRHSVDWINGASMMWMRSPELCSVGRKSTKKNKKQAEESVLESLQYSAMAEVIGSPSIGRKTSHQQPLTVPHCALRPAQSTPTFNGSDSNSNSSCSSTPSSPFVDQQSPAPHRSGRNVGKQDSGLGGSLGQGGGNGSEKQIFDFPSQPEIRIDEVETPANVGTNSSNESDKTVIDDVVQLRHFGPREANITRGDSVDDGQDDQGTDKTNLQRNNSISVTLKEWDIPFQELKLDEQVGRGQFSTVHRGQWHGEVAIKILDMNPDGDNRERLSAFKLEVATLRKTRHDNLVLFMGACMKPPHPLAIVTSFCKGETLHQQLHQRRHKFGVNKSITIALQICQGMSYLHARDIVHKDLKSKNIFVDSVGKVVISDFGLFNATRMCRATTARGDAISVPVGWLGYLAPEIIRRLSVSVSEDGVQKEAKQTAGQSNTGSNSSSTSTSGEEQQLPFSRHSDVFAFGTVWYEMLTVEWPFRTHPPEAIIYLVGNGIKPPLPSVQGPKDIKEILLRCWSYEPCDRSSFVELKAQLEKLPKLHRNPSYPVKSGSMSRSHESLV